MSHASRCKIHKVLRDHHWSNKKKYYYVCVHCPYTLWVLGPKTALGKTFLCWHCNQPFEMDAYSCNVAKPLCTDCRIHTGKRGGKISVAKRIEERPINIAPAIDINTFSKNPLADLMNEIGYKKKESSDKGPWSDEETEE